MAITSQVAWTIKDYDKQAGIFGINIPPLTAGNFATVLANIDTLRGTIDDIIDGVISRESMNRTRDFLAANVGSAEPNAERGSKWIVKTFDNTAELAAGVPNPTYLRPFEYEIPTAKKSIRTASNNVVWVSGGGAANNTDVDAFVTAFEPLAKSPNGGALQVASVEGVTRSGG